MTSDFCTMTRSRGGAAGRNTCASKVEVRSPELKKLSSDYQTTMREFAKAARDIAAAEAKDISKMNAAANAIEKVGKEEEQLVADINKFCQAP